MSITSMITRKLVQPVVYWGNPVDDGYGRYTFDAAVDLTGRWENVKELVKNMEGEEVLSKAKVWVDQDVDEKGYMYLGSTTDSAFNANPLLMEDAMQIIAFGKVPRLGSTTEFERKAYLNITSTQNV